MHTTFYSSIASTLHNLHEDQLGQGTIKTTKKYYLWPSDKFRADKIFVNLLEACKALKLCDEPSLKQASLLFSGHPPTFLHKHNLLKQEKGIGDLIAATLIAELPELGKCSPQQIASLVGVAPYNQDSGNLKGYRCIKGGRRTVRSALYMAVISAVRSNPKIRTFYQRLKQNGKKTKVTLTACIRKFLVILNAILRNAYDKNLIPT